MVLTAPTNTIEGDWEDRSRRGIEGELEGLLKVNLASKMAVKLSFQSNIEFTACP